jgi:hypothetical protein
VFFYGSFGMKKIDLFLGRLNKSVRSLRGSIIATTRYWCLIKGNDYHNTLHNILPSNISSLPVQITDHILGLEEPEKEGWFGRKLIMLNLD